jgi:RNA polymerase sigma-70 factor (ECF subfamily)
MAEPYDKGRLESISTKWTLLKRAHAGAGAAGNLQAAAQAQAELLNRYGGAVRRYMLGSLKDPEAADDLFQDFACRFLRGDFQGANPDKGRFRDFLKGVVSHMVADFCKRRQRQPMGLPEKFPEPAAAPEQVDQLFQESWRDELLAKAWLALEEMERTTAQPFYTVLRFRADHPELRSPELAAGLSEKLQKPITAAGVRQLVHRAREKFADLLRDKVQASIASDDPDDLEAELRELGLAPYLS